MQRDYYGKTGNLLQLLDQVMILFIFQHLLQTKDVLLYPQNYLN